MLPCPNLTSLEHQLTIENEYANDWGYSFNTDKCKFIIFGKDHSKITSVRLGISTKAKGKTVNHVGIILK